jgi:hypothetical protein
MTNVVRLKRQRRVALLERRLKLEHLAPSSSRSIRAIARWRLDDFVTFCAPSMQMTASKEQQT